MRARQIGFTLLWRQLLWPSIFGMLSPKTSYFSWITCFGLFRQEMSYLRPWAQYPQSSSTNLPYSQRYLMFRIVLFRLNLGQLPHFKLSTFQRMIFLILG